MAIGDGRVAKDCLDQEGACDVKDDDERVVKRMQRTALMYNSHGMQSEFISIKGKTSFEKIFSTILFADWTSLALAHLRGVEPGDVPLIEEFKKQLHS